MLINLGLFSQACGVLLPRYNSSLLFNFRGEKSLNYCVRYLFPTPTLRFFLGDSFVCWTFFVYLLYHFFFHSLNNLLSDFIFYFPSFHPLFTLWYYPWCLLTSLFLLFSYSSWIVLPFLSCPLVSFIFKSFCLTISPMLLFYHICWFFISFSLFWNIKFQYSVCFCGPVCGMHTLSTGILLGSGFFFF